MVILCVLFVFFLIWAEHSFNLPHDTPSSAPQDTEHYSVASPYSPSPSCPSTPRQGEPVRLSVRFRRREGEEQPDVQELAQGLDPGTVLIIKNTEKAEKQPQESQKDAGLMVSHRAVVSLTQDAEIQTVFQHASARTQTGPVISTAAQSIPEIPDHCTQTHSVGVHSMESEGIEPETQTVSGKQTSGVQTATQETEDAETQTTIKILHSYILSDAERDFLNDHEEEKKEKASIRSLRSVKSKRSGDEFEEL